MKYLEILKLAVKYENLLKTSFSPALSALQIALKPIEYVINNKYKSKPLILNAIASSTGGLVIEVTTREGADYSEVENAQTNISEYLQPVIDKISRDFKINIKINMPLYI